MMRVLTSILQPAELGKYYLMMSFVASVSLFLISPVSMYISRHYYGWNRIGVGWNVLKKFFQFLLFVSLCSLILVLVLKQFQLVGGEFSYGTLLLLLPLLIVGTTLSSYPQELLNIIGRSRTFVLLNNVELWGKIGSIYLFAILFSPQAIIVLEGLTLWSLLFAILIGAILYKALNVTSIKSSISLARCKEIFHFAWPFSIAAGFYWLQSEGYRFVLRYVASLDAVGNFVVGFSLGATPILVLEGIFNQLYMPTYYKEISVETVESHTVAWNKYFINVIRVFVPCGLYVAFSGPFLVRWLLSSTYWDVGLYTMFGAISQLLRIFSGALNNGFIARKQTRAMLIPNVVGSIVALLGTFIFAFNEPMLGTGIALIAAYASVSVGLYLNLARRIRIHLPCIDVVRSLLWIAPACTVLFISYKLGFSLSPLLNILSLITTGSFLLYVQYVLAKEVWFVSK